MKKILFVEDNKMMTDLYKDLLGDKFALVIAISIVEAEHAFKKHPDISVIVLDGFVFDNRDSKTPDTSTHELLKKFKETFKGVIIASSSDPVARKKMILLGCDHECEKWDVPKKVFEIIGL